MGIDFELYRESILANWDLILNPSQTSTNNSPQLEGANPSLDKLGLLASGLCVVHCLFTPLLLTLIPIMNNHFLETQFHIYFGLLVSSIALFAFWRGYRLHHKKKILLMGSIGLAFLFGGVLSSALLNHSSHSLGIGLTVAGSLVLMSAHILNMRYCKDPCCTAH